MIPGASRITGGLIAAIASCVTADSSQADILGWLAGDTIESTTEKGLQGFDEISGKRLDEFLSGLDQTTENRMQEALAGGRLMTFQMGSEMRLAIAAASDLFGDELSKNIGRMSNEAKRFVAVLRELDNRLQQAGQASQRLIDTATLDIDQLAGRVVGIDEAPLHIRRVSGSILTEGPEGASRQITLVGPFFGSGTSDFSTAYDFSIDGTAVSNHAGNGLHERILTLSYETVNRLVSSKESGEAVLVATITRTWAGRWFWPFRSQKSIRSEVSLLVLPREIGTLDVTLERPVYTWQTLMPREIDAQRLRASDRLSIGLPNRPTDGLVRPGDVAFDADSIEVACQTDIRPMRQIASGEVLPPNHRVFTHGWKSSEHPWSEIPRDLRGMWGDQLAAIVGEAAVATGFPDRWQWLHNTPRTEGVPILGQALDRAVNLNPSSRPPTLRARIGPDVFLQASTAVEIDYSGCSKMKADTPMITEGGSKIFVDIVGKADADAPWSLSAQPLTYAPDGTTSVETHTLPVIINDIVNLDPVDLETLVEFRFRSRILGIDYPFTPEDAAESGFTVLSQDVGEGIRYRLRYTPPA